MSQYHQIADRIAAKIMADEYGDRLPTIDELTREFAVSKVTMQRAIKVLKDKNTIETSPKRGIRPTRLKRARTHVLGAVLATSGGSPLHDQLIAGMNSKALEAGEIVAVTGGTHDDPETELATIRQIVEKQGVDGVILWPTNGTKKESMGVKYLKEKNIPFVLVPEIDLEIYVNCNSISNYDSEGGSEVMMHLLGTGHQKVAYIMGKTSKNTIYNKNRYRQYLRSMELAGLNPLAKLTLETLDPEDLQELDACFCVNDAVAVAILKMCLRAGIRVPGDLAVVGYDNTPTAQMMGLTSVEQHFEKIGAMAVELLLQDIAGKLDSKQQLNVKSELIIRDSTRREG